MKSLNQAMANTDWPLLAEQKLALVEAIAAAPKGSVEALDGLLNWIDAIQDAAEEDGFPVVFLTDCSICGESGHDARHCDLRLR